MSLPSDNPYYALKSPAALYAFVFKEHGEAMLRKTFEHMAQDPLRCTPEGLEDAAKELELLGLDKVAAIIREYASKFLPEDDLSRWPYQDKKPYSLHPRELAEQQAKWKDDVARRRRLGDKWWDRTID